VDVIASDIDDGDQQENATFGGGWSHHTKATTTTTTTVTLSKHSYQSYGSIFWYWNQTSLSQQ
jgi:hypothetical protein